MLMKEEDPHKIFDAMVELMTAGRSRWCCVLHLVRDGELVLQASSGLTGKFKRNLTQFSFDMTDGPEARALRLGGPQVIEDVSQDRRPWPQFLFAYGVQSLWCNPIFAMDGTPLGTLTVYSLLRCTPSKSDWAILDSNAQMAAMVLERHQMQQDLRRHAYHDSLTGLPNRLLGVERLSAAIERSAKTQNPVAVLWLDLDRFKQTNDLHGHGAGDVVLRETARRLQKRFRQSDTVARMGGDEFMAVLEGVPDRQTAESIATALFEELAAPIPFQGLNLMTSASIGVSLYPVDGETAELLERNADLAMYQAKFGRQGVRTYAPALDQALTERREIEKAMVVALEHGGFVLHYQPQYDSHGALSGFEALLRFPHPVLGMISPARLIPIAEESKMIVALGAWVLYEACSQSMRWQAEGLPPMQVAVNISAAQFEQQDFAEQVAAVLGETGLAPHLLELELTESVMVKDFVETTRQLECLKRLGVGIAVDDFGTGYSSLNHLHRLPIDRLKIDRSFIQALGEAKGSLAIIESIILMAHRMGMGVVAEGVETAEEMRTLCLQGCDSLQGYLLARPVEAAAAAKLLAEGSNVHLRRMNSQAASLTMVHRPMLVSA
jgi:diguanylate cyclase (GGDEF)-like protein